MSQPKKFNKLIASLTLMGFKKLPPIGMQDILNGDETLRYIYNANKYLDIKITHIPFHFYVTYFNPVRASSRLEFTVDKNSLTNILTCMKQLEINQSKIKA